MSCSDGHGVRASCTCIYMPELQHVMHVPVPVIILNRYIISEHSGNVYICSDSWLNMTHVSLLQLRKPALQTLICTHVRACYQHTSIYLLTSLECSVSWVPTLLSVFSHTINQYSKRNDTKGVEHLEVHLLVSDAQLSQLSKLSDIWWWQLTLGRCCSGNLLDRANLLARREHKQLAPDVRERFYGQVHDRQCCAIRLRFTGFSQMGTLRDHHSCTYTLGFVQANARTCLVCRVAGARIHVQCRASRGNLLHTYGRDGRVPALASTA